VAAVATAVSQYMAFPDVGLVDGVHMGAIYAGTMIGAITITGSIVAFAKLQGISSSTALALPGKNAINLSLLAINGGALYTFLSAPSMGTGVAALGVTTLISGVLGWHATASVGGADMPVVVTVLNSVSGWALCAEGFMLGSDLLTIVGALIGSSGAILSWIMCKAMNRR
jgi:NAD(P) transhydrogenase